jgi:hypothetical protein
VDGTLLAALPKMTEASLLERKTGRGMVKWRLHTHFEVDRSIPRPASMAPGEPATRS